MTKAWTAIDRLSIIWKSDLTDKMKRSFFQAAVVSILLYGCTTWTLTKRLERRLDGNYTRMLRAVLNKSWRQHPTRLQLYGHLPPITKTIQVRRTRHAGHCWRSKDELISDVLLWAPSHGCASVGRPARTYIQQLCEDTGCNPEDLPEAMSDREKWRETVRDIRADGATWWWWWYIYVNIELYIYIYIYIYVYIGSSVESTEKDIETRLTKAWTAINRLSTIWKSDLTDKMKRSFFQAAVTSILLYGCTTWTLTKRLEKKLDGNYTRMLRAILNKSWQQHPTRHQLYGHLPPITKTIQVRRTRHAGHCWRSRDELIRDVLLWIPTHGRAKAGRPARTYIQQLCEDTGCCPEDLPRAMNDREEWRERVRDIRAASTIWWWWWYI